MEDLVEVGKELLGEEGREEEALEKFTAALEVGSGADGKKAAEVYLLRAQTFVKICEKIRNRPATLSESHALYGMDPLQIAERGLADVEKAALKMDVSNNAGFHFCKGRALELAESFGASRGSYLKALSLDPSDKRIKERLERLDKEMGTKAGRPEAHLAADDFECSLCFKLFYEPVTTCCGHTFCRSCLLRSQDYGNRCPACRTVLFIVTTKLAVNVTLKNIIEKNFKAEYERRGRRRRRRKRTRREK